MRIFNRRQVEVSKADRVWLNSIVKRQYMVVEDLMKFAKIYPDKIDREVVGSLVSIYEMLRDNNLSVQYAHESIDTRAYDEEYMR